MKDAPQLRLKQIFYHFLQQYLALKVDFIAQKFNCRIKYHVTSP